MGGDSRSWMRKGKKEKKKKPKAGQKENKEGSALGLIPERNEPYRPQLTEDPFRV